MHIATIDLLAFEFIKSVPVSLLGAEECGDFGGDLEKRLILSLSLSRTGPGDVHLHVSCLFAV